MRELSASGLAPHAQQCSGNSLQRSIAAHLHPKGTFSKEGTQFVQGVAVSLCDPLQSSCCCDDQRMEKVSGELFEAGWLVVSYHPAWRLAFALTTSNSVSSAWGKAPPGQAST